MVTGAPYGNQNAKKLRDHDIKQQAYKQYCEHLAKGKTKKSWFFKHPELTCTSETFEKYLEDEVEFDPIHLKVAYCEGYQKWEKVLEDGATGENPDVNPACLQMIMRNKYGWDKQQAATTVVIGETIDSRIKGQDGSTKDLVHEERSNS